MKRLSWKAAVVSLALLFYCVPSYAQGTANLVVICAEQSWTSAFDPLESYLEGDWDWEGDRAWNVDVIALSDSSAVRQVLASYSQALQASGGGELFAMVVENPSHSSLIPQRMIYDPEVAGADIGWGDYVPSDDLYCDLDGDGSVEVITFRLPAQSMADCEAYVEKDLSVRFNLS